MHNNAMFHLEPQSVCRLISICNQLNWSLEQSIAGKVGACSFASNPTVLLLLSPSSWIIWRCWDYSSGELRYTARTARCSPYPTSVPQQSYSISSENIGTWFIGLQWNDGGNHPDSHLWMWLYHAVHRVWEHKYQVPLCTEVLSLPGAA